MPGNRPEPAPTETEDGTDDAESLRVLLQGTRTKLVQQLLASAVGPLSARELEYRNPSLQPSTIQYHLRKLQDSGVVTKLKLPKGERTRDLPSTFYAVTDRGRRLLDRANLAEEVDTWREVYERMERTAEIERIEAMDRPGVGE